MIQQSFMLTTIIWWDQETHLCRGAFPLEQHTPVIQMAQALPEFCEAKDLFPLEC